MKKEECRMKKRNPASRSSRGTYSFFILHSAF
jgi:hypothetical protein